MSGQPRVTWSKRSSGSPINDALEILAVVRHHFTGEP
jgi:hypothetical protein